MKSTGTGFLQDICVLHCPFALHRSVPHSFPAFLSARPDAPHHRPPYYMSFDCLAPAMRASHSLPRLIHKLLTCVIWHSLFPATDTRSLVLPWHLPCPRRYLSLPTSGARPKLLPLHLMGGNQYFRPYFSMRASVKMKGQSKIFEPNGR